MVFIQVPPKSYTCRRQITVGKHWLIGLCSQKLWNNYVYQFYTLGLALGILHTPTNAVFLQKKVNTVFKFFVCTNYLICGVQSIFGKRGVYSIMFTDIAVRLILILRGYLTILEINDWHFLKSWLSSSLIPSTQCLPQIRIIYLGNNLKNPPEGK